jgi:hypothetical protein
MVNFILGGGVVRRRRLLRWSKTGVVVGGVAASLIGLAVPAGAATGPVSTTPASQTPQLNATSSTEQIRQLVQCGGTMYAVGTFTSIKRNSTVFARNNIFSFSATSPFLVSSWNPNVNGIVNSIAFNGSNCADAYIGGKFTTVGSTTVKNIAEIDTTTGAVVTAFGHSASAQVETLQGYNGHILVGGYYTSINNSTADPYMTSLNPTTGKDDGFIHLGISGNYSYAPNNATRVYNQQLSNGGTLDLVEGDFTSVGGLQREQIFMLDLSGTTATVTPWTSPQFDGSQPQATSAFQCATVEPFYLQAAAWSPDDSTIYTASTGYHPNGFSTGQGAKNPRTGLCDSAAAFPSTQASVHSLWINYTGCDSLYSVAADSSAAYFGGHERWTENPEGCDAAGPGAIAEPGMEALSPATGLVTSNPPVYTRARGLGADDMLVTSAGLWIASDNMTNASQCDGVFGHAGICFLPYS